MHEELQALERDARELGEDCFPKCPFCGESDMDRLCWDDDCESVRCETCGMCWNPNGPLPEYQSK